MKQYLVQVNYKSGHSMKFWCEEFEATPSYNGSYNFRWKAANEVQRPILLAKDGIDIESVWQIDFREVPDEIDLPVIE
jgi:hypothetical protein